MKQVELISFEEKKTAQLKQNAAMTAAGRFYYMLELIHLSNVLSPNRPPKEKPYFRIFTLKRIHDFHR
ncbi:hypothetical protein QQ054_22420 [Oscillatoria amoena NRMC-F 0135]|nr:hypothetical protein [Oscillatoria amoena NRMC-F 0135]